MTSASVTDIQWLLIGGPRHGETVWAGQNGRFPGPNGTIYYKSNYPHEGRMYRIGCGGFTVCDAPTQDQYDQVPRLIATIGLSPIPNHHLADCPVGPRRWIARPKNL